MGYTWSTWDASVLRILEPSKILSVAWKELNSPNITCKTISDYSGYKKGVIDDTKLIKEVWGVIDKADVVIGHHSDAFDLKKLNARFIWHGLPAPSSYQSIDTKKSASKYFKFDSNSLNNLGAYLNLGRKVENGGFDLWVRCIAGDAEAWELMRKYNSMDVELLEKVYLALRPFIANHPNLSLLSSNTEHNEDTCPVCLAGKLTKRGFAVTRTGKRQRLQCGSCGAWSSGSFHKTKVEVN